MKNKNKNIKEYDSIVLQGFKIINCSTNIPIEFQPRIMFNFITEAEFKNKLSSITVKIAEVLGLNDANLLCYEESLDVEYWRLFVDKINYIKNNDKIKKFLKTFNVDNDLTEEKDYMERINKTDFITEQYIEDHAKNIIKISLNSVILNLLKAYKDKLINNDIVLYAAKLKKNDGTVEIDKKYCLIKKKTLFDLLTFFEKNIISAMNVINIKNSYFSFELNNNKIPEGKYKASIIYNMKFFLNLNTSACDIGIYEIDEKI